MKLYKHKDYGDYKNSQINKNVRKLKNIWVKPNEITMVADHINKHISNAKFGICHGVRNAWEVKQFRKLLNINVIGTDIAPSASKFDHTIEWDFHKVKEEWINNVDFMYSNSFDHSYDPSMCIGKWMSCLTKEGVCYIHWMKTNENKIDAADCFAASRKEYRKIFNKKYKVIDELETAGGNRVIFAIKHV